METTSKARTQELQFKGGDKMPALGLGTWKAGEGEAKKAVYTAIKEGFRHIDCAEMYQNQKEVGEGIRKALDEGICQRDDLWITSKLWNSDHKAEDVEKALKRILDQLGLDYLDLFLIHWLVAFKPGVTMPESGDDFLSPDEAPLTDTWKAMAKCQEKGLTRHIGVSNFNESHLKTVMNAGPVPEMNQVELHPYLQQRDLHRFCLDHEINMTGYSPLGSGDRPEGMKKDDEPVLYENDVIKEIAEEKDCSPFQVLIAWGLNRGTAVIPKSTDPDHIEKNLQALEIELTAEDMEKIAELDHGYRFVDGENFAKDGSPYTLEYLWGKDANNS
jgi:alcohol dehydrogenase (NADP+)